MLRLWFSRSWRERPIPQHRPLRRSATSCATPCLVAISGTIRQQCNSRWMIRPLPRNVCHPDQSPELRTQIEALEAELDLAVQGLAENGWSNVEVVDTVGSLCGDDDLIEWTVQPWTAHITRFVSDEAHIRNPIRSARLELHASS
jgi:hypothetical protein